MIARLFALLAAPFALAVLAVPAAAQKTNPDADQVYEFAEDDPQMDAAIAEAQRTLPEFLALLENPPAGASDFTFKFPLGGWEHIWVDNVQRRGNMLVGSLANHPVQDGWRIGQRVEVPLAEVSDWGWWDARGRAQGYRTLAVIIDRAPPAEAAQMRQGMGW